MSASLFFILATRPKDKTALCRGTSSIYGNLVVLIPWPTKRAFPLLIGRDCLEELKILSTKLAATLNSIEGFECEYHNPCLTPVNLNNGPRTTAVRGDI